MRKPLVAGNWKLNKTASEAKELLGDMLPGLEAVKDVEVLVCPTFTVLAAVSDILKNSSVALGAQNIYWENSGAFTGEISPAMVAEYCSYVIIGHSERRAYFGETDVTVNKRAQAALAVGLTPVVCVGELLEDREAGKEAEVVSVQLMEGLKNLPVHSGKDLVVAYEPVWAIGTGKTAEVSDAVNMNKDVIRPALAKLFGDALAQEIRILMVVR
jgi:triosephosphate isomerase (TIM)